MIKECYMIDCDNEVDTDKDHLFSQDDEGYACDNCMDILGDQ